MKELEFDCVDGDGEELRFVLETLISRLRSLTLVFYDELEKGEMKLTLGILKEAAKSPSSILGGLEKLKFEGIVTRIHENDGWKKFVKVVEKNGTEVFVEDFEP